MSNDYESAANNHIWRLEQPLLVSVDASIDSLSFVSAVTNHENTNANAGFIADNFDDIRKQVMSDVTHRHIDFPFSTLVLEAEDDHLFIGLSSKIRTNSSVIYGYRTGSGIEVEYGAVASTSGGVTKLLEQGEVQAWRAARVLSLVGFVLSSTELNEELQLHAE